MYYSIVFVCIIYVQIRRPVCPRVQATGEQDQAMELREASLHSLKTSRLLEDQVTTRGPSWGNCRDAWPSRSPGNLYICIYHINIYLERGIYIYISIYR